VVGSTYFSAAEKPLPIQKIEGCDGSKLKMYFVDEVKKNKRMTLIEVICDVDPTTKKFGFWSLLYGENYKNGRGLVEIPPGMKTCVARMR
jgi:hypothetical protein